MIKLSVCFAALLCMDAAVAAQPCSKDMAGKTECVAGERMLCNKEFDAAKHDFRYEWHAINDAGQPFDIYYDAMYKKVPGLTPAVCADMANVQNKATPQIGLLHRGKTYRN